MDTENTLGRMEEYMRDFGFKVNSMEMEYLKIRMER